MTFTNKRKDTIIQNKHNETKALYNICLRRWHCMIWYYFWNDAQYCTIATAKADLDTLAM